jgi:ankyrin repeat protein
MNTFFTRKKFLLTAGTAAMAALLPRRDLLGQATPPSPSPNGPNPNASPGELANFPERGPQMEPARVKRFVIAGHVNFPIVKEMLAAEPGLINGAWDWGKGDFETALGGASHMGRRDIAEFLLQHSARMDLFSAAMLGRLDIVKAAVAAFPDIVRVPGPHGIPLIAHAEKGGPPALAVVDFLHPLVG